MSTKEELISLAGLVTSIPIYEVVTLASFHKSEEIFDAFLPKITGYPPHDILSTMLSHGFYSDKIYKYIIERAHPLSIFFNGGSFEKFYNTENITDEFIILLLDKDYESENYILKLLESGDERIKNILENNPDEVFVDRLICHSIMEKKENYAEFLFDKVEFVSGVTLAICEYQPENKRLRDIFFNKEYDYKRVFYYNFKDLLSTNDHEYIMHHIEKSNLYEQISASRLCSKELKSYLRKKIENRSIFYAYIKYIEEKHIEKYDSEHNTEWCIEKRESKIIRFIKENEFDSGTEFYVFFNYSEVMEFIIESDRPDIVKWRAEYIKNEPHTKYHFM